MKKPSRKNAILTQCWECMGYYADGKTDCENVRCPLYAYMPYAKLPPELHKFEYNPRCVGRRLKSDTCGRMSEEQRIAAGLRLKTAREASDEQ